MRLWMRSLESKQFVGTFDNFMQWLFFIAATRQKLLTLGILSKGADDASANIICVCYAETHVNGGPRSSEGICFCLRWVSLFIYLFLL